ncbi:phosphoserine phosphatase SerB [Sphaeroforma arctica JP610]|uniref:phosphoserine phosphatase n=1 Tax=Sphaeroforma arctica JP610 TaxID=667725 RepID=A0A0L0FMF1_9EUKA|nr:phosphoserine phosphatase SerB [Sphaeroforma arctica JP610]KNC77935.1 phosphoserine phosphatase SerB [Sphaeroforma arctica JP610]|eukprot:XP_014151837.1 phosphoserine phosphatase SerB [Sphaeroforma arctica JP610]
MALPIDTVRSLMQAADAVCFDVDSTVVQHEGIDELAAVCGVGEAVAAWTKKAMEGNTLFQDSLKARLFLIQPSKKDIAKCLEPGLGLTTGVKELIQKMKDSGKDVYLVSGGFRQMIYPVGAEVGIPEDHVYANNILFDDKGDYAGFDDTEPTSRTGGKPKVIQELIAKGHKKCGYDR